MLSNQLKIWGVACHAAFRKIKANPTSGQSATKPGRVCSGSLYSSFLLNRSTRWSHALTVIAIIVSVGFWQAEET